MEALPNTGNEALPPSSTSSTAPRAKPQGKGAKDKKIAQFRARKGKDQEQTLRASVFARLSISDPTKISAISLSFGVKPATVPIVLSGIPRLLTETWTYMKARGPRSFAVLATEENRAIFFKICLTLFEAKVCYAQQKAIADVDLPTRYIFSEMDLRAIKSLAQLLPAPIVIALESLGNFLIDGQPVVPIFPRALPERRAAAVTCATSSIRALMLAFGPGTPFDADYAAAAEVLSQLLPGVAFIGEGQDRRITQPSVDFWAGGQFNWNPVPGGQRAEFLALIAALAPVKGMLLACSITHGDGSATPCVRFPAGVTPSDGEVSYYLNTRIDTFSQQLAPALLYGLDDSIVPQSRFVTDQDNCLIRGAASALESVTALVWNTPE